MLQRNQTYMYNNTRYEIGMGEYMSGSVHTSKDGTTFIKWYDRVDKKRVKIYRDRRGTKFYNDSHAQKTLSQMQGDVERGVFDVRNYSNKVSEIVKFIDEWFEITQHELSPATAKGYKGYIQNHLKPFFEKQFIQLHEIRLSHLTQLLQGLKPIKGKAEMSGKMKFNIMSCLRTCLDYAWRDGIIQVVPPFPKKRAYNIQEPEIKWLPSDRQEKVLSFIPEEHQPIFWWLKFHVRRPAEAMTLHKVDYSDGVFTIKRSLSARKVVMHTKTNKVHTIPMMDEFEHYLIQALKTPILSPFMFTCASSKNEGKRYSSFILNRLWKEACEKAGEDIDLYSGLKHSTCCQYINESGLSLQDVQTITDHADIRSTAKYGQTEIARKKELMQSRVIKMKKKISNK